jgi:ABC-type multidrug transport system fused ATPase/permease subunit
MNHLRYLKSLFAFAFANNPTLYSVLLLAVGSTFVELAAISCLMPLIGLTSGGTAPGSGVAVRALGFLGIRADGYSLLMLFIASFSLRILTQFGSQVMAVYISRSILKQLTTRAFAALVTHVPIRDIETRSIGYYISMAGDEAARSSNIVLTSVNFISVFALACLYYYAIAAYSKPAALFLAGFLIATFLLLIRSFLMSQRLGFRQIEQSQSATSFFVDAVNSLRAVRSFSAEQYVSNQYYSQIRTYMRTLVLIDLISLAGRLGPALFLLCLVALVVSWPALHNYLSFELPFLVTVIVLTLRFFPLVGQGLTLLLRIVADTRAGRDVTELITTYEHHPLGTNPAPPSAGKQQIRAIDVSDIRFEHVPGRAVLDDFSVSLRAGRGYALVGPSGSGKSTFLDLILGFYEPESGAIIVNGDAAVARHRSSLRGRIILVSQESAIFNDTVLNNLLLGVDAPRAAVERAARIAGAHDFIRELPQGYDTVLNYRGSNLSGGQRQRIGIARAVLRNPDVILLDESTSALDSDTRKQVVANLRKEFADRIILFVTHDGFVISQVDEVLDMARINRGIEPTSVIDRSTLV